MGLLFLMRLQPCVQRYFDIISGWGESYNLMRKFEKYIELLLKRQSRPNVDNTCAVRS